jgi:hypothetical protein
MARKARSPKPRRVSYELIPRDHITGFPMYSLLDELVHAHHDQLKVARIALAWCTSWQPDLDGRVTLGQCKRASDLDRELAAFDFVILLRKSFWQNDHVTDEQRRALLDHELCHGARALDKHGDPVIDERGRPVWRTRRHNVEEFAEVVERHGMWTADLERVALALRRQAAGPFKPCTTCQLTPGWVPTGDGRAVSRCACWVNWAAQREEQRADQATA